MPELTTDRQQQLLADLQDLAALRAESEDRIQTDYDAHNAEFLQQYRSQRDDAISQFEKRILRLRNEYKTKREEAIYQFESESYQAVQEHEQDLQQAAQDRDDEADRGQRRRRILMKKAEEDHQTAQEAPKQQQEQAAAQCETLRKEMDAVEAVAQKILRRRGCDVPEAAPPEPSQTSGAPRERYQAALQSARRTLRGIERQPAARFIESGWPFLVFLLTAIGTAYPCFAYLGPMGAVVWLVGSGVVGVASWLIAKPFSQKQTMILWPALQQILVDGRAAVDEIWKHAKETAYQKLLALAEHKDELVRRAQTEWAASKAQQNEAYQKRVQQAEADFKQKNQQRKQEHDQTLAELDGYYPQEIEQTEQRFLEDTQVLDEQRSDFLDDSRREFERRWGDLIGQWSAGFGQFRQEVEGMRSYCGSRFPRWSEFAVDADNSPGDDLPALQVGDYRFDLGDWENGLPKDPRLAVEQTEFLFPAMLSYPQRPSLLLKTEGEGRDAAVHVLQNVMLRLLTSLPPGKVRYTIIDPTGLGQNFSAFMHLADYDERLVNNRIWTETVHIQQRLADLTEHMENVIQKYLRNEFESIQEYNQHAGEVAEPYQILVVANFPANFSEEAGRRLISIASSGARCGVYTLISADVKMKLPKNFDLDDLGVHAETLTWNTEEKRFLWGREALQGLPLELETPPDDEFFTDVVRKIGELSIDANRVEVPFSSVVAPENQWWTEDSREEIVVPLGRAGATKLQTMRLGKGTSQHVLVSGKTGSGKSTLLHATITNLATYYSPREIQFYLIDFKKGVEFKAYAALNLPHARVIAIESEREFGMSVLARLDAELKRRGDLFRSHGVQDVKGYRDAHPEEEMPRILLLIDEFQEFFVKDDKIGQDASLLLDRLVRQGRAFGIHVMLGSQTLAGAYSLARSTLGQMAVRIALQCSEADAHLILSDDNTAARLLNRPGEAIYNDANGVFEGNHPFQVVWLPDQEREHYLTTVAHKAAEQNLQLEPPIVFEGNVAADPSNNPLLRKTLETPPQGTATSPLGTATSPRGWLGEAIAIKDPPAATFRRQSGSNLLIVGQQEEAALGVMSNALLSVASELMAANTPAPKFYVLDGQRLESPQAGFWKRFTKRLPLDWTLAEGKQTAKVIEEIAAEVDRRLEEQQDDAAPIFLSVYNLARFRELRKSEEFSFSMDEDSSPSLDKQLATILREGPNFGVHSLLWCDTYNNVNRWLERQSMNDLGMRVLFQMSASDSSNLMDSPEAGRLGVHRAIWYDEEQGEFERFRPYRPPEESWLDQVCEFWAK